MQEDYKYNGPYYSFTIKVNSKGEVSGEYTVKADTLQELSNRHNEMKDLLRAEMYR